MGARSSESSPGGTWHFWKPLVGWDKERTSPVHSPNLSQWVRVSKSASSGASGIVPCHQIKWYEGWGSSHRYKTRKNPWVSASFPVTFILMAVLTVAQSKMRNYIWRCSVGKKKSLRDTSTHGTVLQVSSPLLPFRQFDKKCWVTRSFSPWILNNLHLAKVKIDWL